MRIIKAIENATKPCVVITTPTHKVQILSTLQAHNIMKPIQFLTPRDLFDKVFFKLKPEAIYTLSNALNKKPSIITDWLKFIPFLPKEHNANETLRPLFAVRDLLYEHDLFEPNPFKALQFKDKALFVYGVFNEPYMKPLLKQLAKEHPLTTVAFDEYQQETATLMTADTMESEVVDIALNIIDAVHEGTALESIKLFNVPSSYEPVFKSVFKTFNIPLTMHESYPLMSYPLTLEFLNRLSSACDDDLKSAVTTVLEDLNKTVYDETSKQVLFAIKSVLNPVVYYADDVKENLDYIRYLFEQKKLSGPVYKPSVTMIKPEQFDPSNVKLLFVPGMNEGDNFVYSEEDDVLDETTKQALGYPTANDLNQARLDLYTKALFKAPRVIFTRAKKDATGVLEPSPILTSMRLEPRRLYDHDGQSHSELYDALRLKEDKDHFDVYGKTTNRLLHYYQAFKSWFTPYDNRFTGLSKPVLNDLLVKKNLSVTKMETFFSCRFRFLLEHFLSMQSIDNQRALDIGNIFHDVLEHHVDTPLSPDYLENQIASVMAKNDDATARDRFFLNRAMKDIKTVLNIIASQEDASHFTVADREKALEIPIKNGFILKGKIDKIMRDHDHVVLIDYKTGQATLNLKLAYHGLKGQLLFYALLYGEYDTDAMFAGLYEQTVLHPTFKAKEAASLEQALQDKLKLIGYSTKDQDVLMRFDPTFADSDLIKSMRLKNDGSFYRYTKTMEQRDVKGFQNRLRSLLNQAVDTIEAGDFTINPKAQGNYQSCQHCPFKDVCYKTPQDTVKLSDFDKDEDVFEAVRKELV